MPRGGVHLDLDLIQFRNLRDVLPAAVQPQGGSELIVEDVVIVVPRLVSDSLG